MNTHTHTQSKMKLQFCQLALVTLMTVLPLLAFSLIKESERAFACPGVSTSLCIKLYTNHTISWSTCTIKTPQARARSVTNRTLQWTPCTHSASHSVGSTYRPIVEQFFDMYSECVTQTVGRGLLNPQYVHRGSMQLVYV